MALIDIRCASCDTISEVYRSAKDWPATPPCPKCDATATEQIHLPRGSLSTAPAVVVYKAPDGTFRYPGDTQGSATAKYDRLGYQRIEARGWAEVRKLESSVNAQQASDIRRRVERQCESRERGLSVRHSEVRRAMEQGFQVPEHDSRGRPTGRMKTVRLSEQGRAIMRAAVDRTNGKSGPQAREPGFRVEAYSENRSNRDESRGPDGRRFRD